MVTGGEKPCYAVPKVNGKWVSLGDMFNLYSNEWGKPRELILLYQYSQLIDLVVLQWMRDVNGKPMPKYMGTIFPDTAIPSPDIWELSESGSGS